MNAKETTVTCVGTDGVADVVYAEIDGRKYMARPSSDTTHISLRITCGQVYLFCQRARKEPRLLRMRRVES